MEHPIDPGGCLCWANNRWAEPTLARVILEYSDAPCIVSDSQSYSYNMDGMLGSKTTFRVVSECATVMHDKGRYGAVLDSVGKPTGRICEVPVD